MEANQNARMGECVVARKVRDVSGDRFTPRIVRYRLVRRKLPLLDFGTSRSLFLLFLTLCVEAGGFGEDGEVTEEESADEGPAPSWHGAASAAQGGRHIARILCAGGGRARLQGRGPA